MLFEKLLGIQSVPVVVSHNQLYSWGDNTVGELGIGNIVNKSSPVHIGTNSWSQVSIGTSFTLALRSDKTLWAWGYNYYGQLGVSTGVYNARYSTPVTATSPATWSMVADGASHVIAIKSDGSLWGWGLNTSGQVGVSSLVNISSPVLVSGPASTSWSVVAAGASFSLAITTTGQLYGWGQNVSGQVGINSTSAVSSPVLVSGPAATSWMVVAAGASHSVAITSALALYAWGLNSTGQLGDSTLVSKLTPVAITGFGGSWQSVAAGAAHTLGITGLGNLYGWGLNTSGQVGINSVTTVSSPVFLTAPASTSWVSVAAGSSHSLGITTTGILYGWGQNTSGQLGIASVATKSSPVIVSGPTGASWSVIAAGSSFSLGIANGVLYGWGQNTSGQLGFGSLTTVSLPVQVNLAASGTTSISAGALFASSINSSKILFSWGDNTYYQAFPVLPYITSPIQIGSSSWTVVAAGAVHSLGILATGALYGWGLNTSGQIGVNTILSVSSPVLVSGPTSTSWSAISAGQYHSLAITSANVLYGWGLNTAGQAGILSLTTVSSPVVVSGVTAGVNYSWKAVSSGSSFTVAIRSDGTLWSWGDNSSGELGNLTSGASLSVSSPVLVSGPAGASWSKIAAGQIHALAITTTGQLYAWGYNGLGEIGNFTSSNSISSPVLVSGPVGASWAAISGGTEYSLAITTTGQLYAWGGNHPYGNLGNNDPNTQPVSSPVLVSGPAGTSWSVVAAGQSHTLALTSSGLLYAWGWNAYGQLGTTQNFVAPNYTTPVTAVTTSPATWLKISAGNEGGTTGGHTLAIKSDGTLWGWGENRFGELGNLTTTTATQPVLISGPAGASWTAISTGTTFSLGITTTGVLYGWGDNTTGQLGIGSTTATSSPVAVVTPSAAYSWTQISAPNQGTTFLGIRSDGTLWAWGLNINGQLGINSTTSPITSPTLVSGPAGASWSAVAAGTSHSLGITTAGRLYAWGYNLAGAVGNLSTTDVSSPVLVSGPASTSWSAVAAGFESSFGITNIGVLYAWGYNFYGELGINSTTTVSSPVLVSGPAGASWSVVSAGASHTLGVTTTGLLYGWGYNNSGQVGVNSLSTISSPVLVSGPAATSWSTVAAGALHSLALTSTKLLYGWGQNTSGQVGINSLANVSSPVAIVGPAAVQSWKQVAGSAGATLAIKSDGTLWGWGANPAGAVGNLSTATVSSPVLVSGPAGASWSAIAAGASHSLGITTTGQLYGWGLNASGQLGINTLTPTSSPVLVSGPIGASWSTISAGGVHSLGITTTGLIYGWGLNNSGQVGINSTATVSSPVLVSGPAATSWSAVAAGASHSLGIATTGQLYGWGLNASGQLGIAALTTKLSPVLVSGPAATSWSVVAAGLSFSFGITTTGRLYGWGLNTSGQLGINSTTTVSSPVLVSGPVGASWTVVTGGSLDSYGITNTNLLYSWGSGANGALGTNSITNVSSPVLVSGPVGASWLVVAAGTQYGVAITSLNLLYGWGYNGNGNLGINSITTVSSPVVVSSPNGPILSWNTIAAGQYHSFGITNNGILYAWGLDSNGQLGNLSTASPVISPVLVSGPTATSWSSVTAGANFSAAITTTGILYDWGLNTSGQLGNGTSVTVSSPIVVYSSIPPISWTAISAGATHVLGITTTGQLYAWGDNTYGELGNLTSGASLSVSSPVLVSGPATTSWSVVAAGGGVSMAITTIGQLYGWGYNTSGVIGNLSTVPVSSPVLVSGPTATSWTAVSVWNSALGLTTTGLLYAWGDNTFGNLGINSQTPVSSPVLVSGPASTSWSAVFVRGASMAITTTGQLYGWGYNLSAQVGNGTALNFISSPVLVSGPASTSWSAITGGNLHSAALTISGIIYEWGDNTTFQTVPNFPYIISPYQVGSSSWSAISAGYNHSLGITTNLLYSWGDNSFWELGLGSTGVLTPNSPSPVLVSGPTNASWSAIAAGYSASLGITTTGQMYGWGLNTSGQLGINSITTVSSPVLVSAPAATSFTSVSFGSDGLFSSALTTTNLIYATGYNNSGQVGINSTTTVSSPIVVQGPYSVSWAAVSAGSSFSFGITTLGLLYAWGSGTSGDTGINSTATVSSPVLVSGPTGASWSVVSGGFNHAVGITTTGLLYAWGYNGLYQLGTLSATSVSSPVLVSGPAGTSWSTAVANYDASFGITTTGILYGWGLNTSGQLGTNSTTSVSSPVLVSGPAGTSWASIATGQPIYHSLAITT